MENNRTLPNGFIVVGFYMQGEVLPFEFADGDKKGGEIIRGHNIKHQLSWPGVRGRAGAAIMLTERLPEGQDVKDVELPVLSGKRVMVPVTSVRQTKGGGLYGSVNGPFEILGEPLAADDLDARALPVGERAV